MQEKALRKSEERFRILPNSAKVMISIIAAEEIRQSQQLLQTISDNMFDLVR